MGTALDDVGLQVWNGAVVMSEFVLQNPTLFKGIIYYEMRLSTPPANFKLLVARALVFSCSGFCY